MSAALGSERMPYPRPALGAPVRVAFLGPAATAAGHALHAPVPGVLPRFIDVRAGGDPRALRATLAEAAPHVAVVLAPELVAPEALAGLRAATLAVAAPGADRPAPRDYDRVLLTPGSVDGAWAWRSRPLPVDDRLFAAVRPSRRPPRALCVARSTEHREWLLLPAKHAHDIVHYAHGLTDAALSDALASADVGVALHPRREHGFPPQALLHLAAGHLLLTERLAPACGLEAGIHFLEFDSRDALLTLLMQLEARPDAYDRVRVRGHMAAQAHRASVVWPRIVGDLLADLQAFGTARTLQA